MSSVQHASCGYSEFAPGCDDAACLLHRIEVSTAKGWDATSMQLRLDAVVDVAAAYLLGVTAPTTVDVRER